MVGGSWLLTGMPAEANVWATLVPGFAVATASLGAVFVAATTTALGYVSRQEAGLASGMVNTFHEVGGSVGVAALSTVAATGIETGANTGFSTAFMVCAVSAALAALIPSSDWAPLGKRSGDRPYVPAVDMRGRRSQRGFRGEQLHQDRIAGTSVRRCGRCLGPIRLLAGAAFGEALPPSHELPPLERRLGPGSHVSDGPSGHSCCFQGDRAARPRPRASPSS